MFKRTAKVNLDASATENIKEIANKLGIEDIEVIRKGVAFMELYSKLQDSNGRVLIEENGETRPLTLSNT